MRALRFRALFFFAAFLLAVFFAARFVALRAAFFAVFFLEAFFLVFFFLAVFLPAFFAPRFFARVPADFFFDPFFALRFPADRFALPFFAAGFAPPVSRPSAFAAVATGFGAARPSLRARQPSMLRYFARATLSESTGVSRLIVDPAARNVRSPISTGATRLTLQPMNAPSPTTVSCFS